MALPEILRKNFVEQVVRIVFFRVDLLQNHFALAHDVFQFEERMEDQVAQDIEGGIQMLVEYHRIKADAFLGRERVQVAADGIHGPGDLLGAARGGPLEDHVLNKVGYSVSLRRLLAGAGVEPDSHGHRPHMLHVLGDYLETVWEDYL